jgi:hypothetical protein
MEKCLPEYLFFKLISEETSDKLHAEYFKELVVKVKWQCPHITYSTKSILKCTTVSG